MTPSVAYIVLMSTDDGATTVYSVKATEAAAEREVQELSSRLNDVTAYYEAHEVEE